MRIRPGVEFASLSDVGCRRENNEDSFSYWEPDDDALFERAGRLAVVADGMGGHEGGQVASRLAVEVVVEAYAGSFSGAMQPNPQECLQHAFAEAHREIQQQALSNANLNGMGTTCTAFSVVGNGLHFAHIGDSRLYLLTEGKLRILTRDHTLVARWVENGVVRPEDAEKHPQKHVLTAALGVAEEVQPDFPKELLSLRKGDALLLCTDGLWGQVEQNEIQEALASQPPRKACGSLMKMAKDRGGPDNITLQIMRIV